MKQEPIHTGEFILSEGKGAISRDAITLAQGQQLAAGTILGKITETGQYAAYDNTATDGRQTAVAILLTNTDASAEATPTVAITRMAEVDGKALIGLDDAAAAALADKMIIVR